MPRYFIGMYQPDGVTPTVEALAPIMREIGALMDELSATGSLVFSNGFDTSVPATLVTSDGTSITESTGSFHTGETQLGGFSVIDVPDATKAHDVATRMATITGLPIEIRLFADRG
ncbi:MAG: hypothetical protein JWP75_1412 [Frondihabitans sp.]|nr:hypothetical protein [Frondihabitans sp.]